MSYLEARQARPATPRMTKHHGPVVPPGRSMRPEPVQKEKKAMQKEKRPLSKNARTVLSQLEHNGPATGAELAKATGLSEGSVSTALKALREAGEVTSKKTGLNGGAILNTSTAWAMVDVEVEVKRRKDGERFDEARADRIGQNGNDGAHYGAEDDEPCDVQTAVVGHEGGSGDTQTTDPAELTRMYLRLVGTGIEQLEQAANSGIQPLPADDYRIKAMRRLVPLVAPDIGEAITDLIEHVTGKEVA